MESKAPRTYRAAGNVVAAAGILPFLTIVGAAGRVLRVTKIIIHAPTLTAIQLLRIAVNKYSAIPTGGTSTNPAEVPLDSLGQAPGGVVNAYTAAPTAGTSLGPIAERTVIGQATAPVVGAALDEGFFDFTAAENLTEFPTLRGAAQCLGVHFPVAPASAVTLSYTVEWTEDGN